MLTLIASMLLCGVAVWLVFGACATLLYRPLRITLLTIEPSQASNLLLAWLAWPLLAALLTGYVLYSPDLAQWLVTGHCHLGDCSRHGPQSTLAIVPTLALALWALYRLLHCLLRQWSTARRLRLALDSIGVTTDNFVRLESSRPMAFTLGWFKPEIFISAGMLAACSNRDITCIVQHERAHRERHDNLRLFIAQMLSAPLPASWSQAMLNDLKLFCEKACDLSAAHATSRECVAAALVRVARLQHQTGTTADFAFVGNQTEQRIRTLLDAPQSPLANERVFAAGAASLLIILWLVNPLHRALELLQ